MWDADPVLRGIRKEIADFVSNGLTPDIVAITGDIAAYGQDDDYLIAERFLRERNVSTGLRQLLVGISVARQL